MRHLTCTHCGAAILTDKRQDPDLDTGHGCCDACWLGKRPGTGRRHLLVAGDCGCGACPCCRRLILPDAADARRAAFA